MILNSIVHAFPIKLKFKFCSYAWNMIPNDIYKIYDARGGQRVTRSCQIDDLMHALTGREFYLKWYKYLVHFN